MSIPWFAVWCLFLSPLPHTAHAVLFSTRYVEGSTCLHHMDTGLPFRFDTGQAAEMVMRSIAVQVTRRGVRFISPLQHMRADGVVGWESFDCIQSGSGGGVGRRRRGSMCSIPVDADSNEVLPCGGGASSHAPPFVPRCSKDTSVSPLGMQRLLESVPESIRGCKGFGGGSGGSGGSNLRVVIPPPMGKVYDLTQCDFQLVGMTAVFVRQENKIYLTHGLEIGGWVYALVGILVVVLVGCITQNIVHIIDPEGSRPSISWIGVAAAFASLMVVVSSMESLSRSMLVTHEDVVAYWYMVCYCIVRILVSADVEIPLAYQNIKGWFRKKRKVHPDDNGTSETKPLLGESSMAKEGDDKQSDDDFRNNHNLLATSLQLLSTRIHMTTATPYTLLLAALVGFRVFHKVYAGKTRENSQGKVADIVLDGIMVVDTVLFYILCLVGVLPQYSTSMEGYAGILTMTFACLTVARIMESRKPKK